MINDYRFPRILRLFFEKLSNLRAATLMFHQFTKNLLTTEYVRKERTSSIVEQRQFRSRQIGYDCQFPVLNEFSCFLQKTMWRNRVQSIRISDRNSRRGNVSRVKSGRAQCQERCHFHIKKLRA